LTLSAELLTIFAKHKPICEFTKLGTLNSIDCPFRAIALGLVLPASSGFAQQNDPGDQPGLIADDSVELEPAFRRTMVAYRTTEPAGTILIQTADPDRKKRFDDRGRVDSGAIARLGSSPKNSL
jgi:hypothetical protein